MLLRGLLRYLGCGEGGRALCWGGERKWLRGRCVRTCEGCDGASVCSLAQRKFPLTERSSPLAKGRSLDDFAVWLFLRKISDEDPVAAHIQSYEGIHRFFESHE